MSNARRQSEISAWKTSMRQRIITLARKSLRNNDRKRTHQQTRDFKEERRLKTKQLKTLLWMKTPDASCVASETVMNRTRCSSVSAANLLSTSAATVLARSLMVTGCVILAQTWNEKSVKIIRKT
jgi:hypothetical protein